MFEIKWGSSYLEPARILSVELSTNYVSNEIKVPKTIALKLLLDVTL